MPDAVLPNTLRTGDQRSAPKVQANLEALRDAMNGLTDDNVAGAGFSSAALADALAVLLGLTKGSTVRRSAVAIATEQSRVNTSYGLLSTPDRIQGVVVPTNGKLIISYRAMVKASVGGSGSCAIFLGANQLKNVTTANAPALDAATGLMTTADTYGVVETTDDGLGTPHPGTAAFTGFVTTGQVLRTVEVEVAAGSYDVSVQFAATAANTVTAKERLLTVRSEGF